MLAWTAFFGSMLWSSLYSTKWIPYEPNWWLVHSARSVESENSTAALTELLNRLKRGEISQTHVSSLVEYAISLQGLKSARWRDGWDALVLQAWQNGQLPTHAQRQFSQQALSFTFRTTEPDIRQWQIVLGSVDVDGTDALSGQFTFEFSCRSATVDGQPTPLNAGPGVTERTTRGQVSRSLAYAMPIIVAPGRHELHLTLSAVLQQPWGTGPPLAWDVSLIVPLVVLPPADSAVELVIGPHADTAMRSSFEFLAIGLHNSPKRLPRGNGVPTIVLLTNTGTMPYCGEFQFGIADDSPNGRTTSDARILLSHRAYEGRRNILGFTADVKQLSISIQPMMNRILGPVSIGAGDGPRWFGPMLEFASVPVQWYDSMEDPGMPESIRELLNRKSGWHEVGSPHPFESKQPHQPDEPNL